jgi:hypothetical protein
VRSKSPKRSRWNSRGFSGHPGDTSWKREIEMSQEIKAVKEGKPVQEP